VGDRLMVYAASNRGRWAGGSPSTRWLRERKFNRFFN